MLNMLENFDLEKMEHNSPEYIHLITEIKKLAFADRDAYISDPDFSPSPVDKMLNRDYAAIRGELIDDLQQREHSDPGLAVVAATIYLTVVHKDRSVSSFITGIFTPIGSAVVAGDTGVLLQSRAAGFSLEEDH